MKWTAGCLLAAMLGSTALACDHPGTPKFVNAKVRYSDVIELDISNNQSESDKTDIWYMVEGKTDPITRFNAGKKLPGVANLGPGDVSPWYIIDLAPNQNHCFRVWTRDHDIKGCESEQPSGWVCAFTDPKLGTSAADPNSFLKKYTLFDMVNFFPVGSTTDLARPDGG